MKNKKDQHTETVINQIINPESNFIEDIEHLVQSENITYIDAILHWCERKQIQIEQIVPLIRANAKFKKKFTAEAKRLNWLRIC